MPRHLFNTKHPDAKSIPVLANCGLFKKKKKKKKGGLGVEYSTTSSLNKGSPSSEVHVSRMPKLHTAKQAMPKLQLKQAMPK